MQPPAPERVDESGTPVISVCGGTQLHRSASADTPRQEEPAAVIFNLVRAELVRLVTRRFTQLMVVLLLAAFGVDPRPR